MRWTCKTVTFVAQFACVSEVNVKGSSARLMCEMRCKRGPSARKLKNKQKLSIILSSLNSQQYKKRKQRLNKIS